mgnify:CR=1 FL=1
MQFFKSLNRKSINCINYILFLSIKNYNKNVEIKSAIQTMVFDLKQAQSKSMIGEGNFKWGLHFVNNTDNYYEIFSTPTDYGDGGKVIVSKIYLLSY